MSRGQECAGGCGRTPETDDVLCRACRYAEQLAEFEADRDVAKVRVALDAFSRIDGVRELHVVDEFGGRLDPECLECSAGSEDGVMWPCPTAQLVYSIEETSETVALWRGWWRWGRERERRAQLAKGWSTWDDLALSLSRQLVRRMTGERFIADKLFTSPPPGGRTFVFEINSVPDGPGIVAGNGGGGVLR